MGGDTEKKMENVEKTKKEEEESAPFNFAELRDDLFREAAELLSEAPDTRIAIFVTPPSSESDAPVHSFAHPSVEGVLQTFIEDSVPVPEDTEEEEDDDDEEEEEEEDDPSRKRFWWEEMDYESMDLEEVLRARNDIAQLLSEIGKVSGNQKDLIHNDDKDAPKS